MVVRQEGGSVEAVAQAPETNREAKTQHVGDGAGEETDYGKDTVESGIGVGLGGLVDLTAATQTTEGVEHSRAHEAHHGDHEQLDGGRGIPDFLLALAERVLETLVDPAGGAVDHHGGVGETIAVASNLGRD